MAWVYLADLPRERWEAVWKDCQLGNLTISAIDQAVGRRVDRIIGGVLEHSGPDFAHSQIWTFNPPLHWQLERRREMKVVDRAWIWPHYVQAKVQQVEESDCASRVFGDEPAQPPSRQQAGTVVLQPAKNPDLRRVFRAMNGEFERAGTTATVEEVRKGIRDRLEAEGLAIGRDEIDDERKRQNSDGSYAYPSLVATKTGPRGPRVQNAN
jgi:hypothetical protein